MTLVWTRAPYYWEEDYRLLKGSGINFLYIPCIDYQLISEVSSPELKKASKSVCIFTSFLAAKIFLEKKYFSDLLWHSQIYVMGAKTFDLVSSYNFRVKLLKSPSAEEFSQKIFDKLEGNEEIYLPGASERAFPMDSFFS